MTEHVSNSTLEALEAGRLSKEAKQALRRHVRACERCRGQVPSRFGNDLSGTSRDKYSRVIDKVFDDVLGESRLIEGQRVTAAELAAELSGLSENQQKLLVKNSPRYRTWGLAEQLLADCRAGWSNDPRRSESIALLAIDVVGRVGAEGFRRRLLSDLEAEAWSYVANCRRICFDLTGAAEAFRVAESLLDQGTGDAMERARFLDLKASYWCTAGRFDDAADALTEAIASYRKASDSHLEGRAFLKYAKILYDSGRLEAAIPALEKASSLVDFAREPYLGFLLKWTRLSYLIELGWTDEASSLLPEVREMARGCSAPRLERLRLLWTEGLLRKKLGQVELAEEVLKQVREGYVAAEIASDVALVSLDLAALYLQVERNHEVRRLAVETVPLFASRGVHRELVVAWSLFEEAARKDMATLQLVGEVATRIRKTTQHQP